MWKRGGGKGKGISERKEINGILKGYVARCGGGGLQRWALCGARNGGAVEAERSGAERIRYKPALQALGWR